MRDDTRLNRWNQLDLAPQFLGLSAPIVSTCESLHRHHAGWLRGEELEHLPTLSFLRNATDPSAGAPCSWTLLRTPRTSEGGSPQSLESPGFSGFANRIPNNFVVMREVFRSVQLEAVLRQIDPDDVNLIHGRLLLLMWMTPPIWHTAMPSGASNPSLTIKR